MPKPQYIRCPDVPKFENLNQAVKVGNEIHVAGVIGMTKAMKMVDGLEAQAHYALQNLKTMLEYAGSDLEHVYALNVFLDLSLTSAEVDKFNEVYRRYFKNEAERPIRCCVYVKLDDLLVEIVNTRALLKDKDE